MIRRHFTADCINLVVNDPSVKPFLGGADPNAYLDLTEAIKNPNNYCLMGEYGGVIFARQSPGVYEAHTQVLRQGRGRWTLNMVNEALEWMFTQTDCVDIVTRVPIDNLPARALAMAIHGKKEYRLEQGWVSKGKIVPADVYSLQIQTWMAKAPGLEQWGEKFHHRLEEEYHRLGKDHGPNHGEDKVHDRYVGAAYLMVMGGQALKGMVFYNRWAGMAGYAPMNVASVDPVVIDIQESLLAVKDGDFFVLRMK